MSTILILYIHNKYESGLRCATSICDGLKLFDGHCVATM